MNRSIIVGIIVVLVLIGGAWFLRRPRPAPATPSPSATNVADSEQKKMEVMKLAMKDQSSKKGELKDVSGGNSSGMAFNLRKDGKLLHTASAKLPDPQGNNFYEGWLMENNSKGDFIRTGILEKQKDGTYEVSAELNGPYDGYDFVVITLETAKDNTPEKHILEGTLN